MRRLATLVLCLALSPAGAQGLSVAAGDTAHAVVAAQKGKRITLRLASGQELSGIVREATDKLVVLGEVSGREFFDAVVPVGAIEAVLIRTRP